MLTCPEGHIYDEKKNKECPFCKIHSGAASVANAYEKLVVPEIPVKAVASAPTEKKSKPGYRIMRDTPDGTKAEKASVSPEAEPRLSEAVHGSDTTSSEAVCPAGHSYDKSKHDSCPVCSELMRKFAEMTSKTDSSSSAQDSADGVVAIYSLGNIPQDTDTVSKEAEENSSPSHGEAVRLSPEEMAAWDSAAESHADKFRGIAENTVDEKDESFEESSAEDKVLSEEKVEAADEARTVSKLSGTALSLGRLRGTLISSFGSFGSESKKEDTEGKEAAPFKEDIPEKEERPEMSAWEHIFEESVSEAGKSTDIKKPEGAEKPVEAPTEKGSKKGFFAFGGDL